MSRPKMHVSNEATSEQLELAVRQGEAFGAALNAMAEQDWTVMQSVDDYRIAIAVEEAEGMWCVDGDDLVWSAPDEDAQNVHVEAVIADRADGRFLPGLSVSLELIDPDGRSLGRKDLPFIWHPFLYHYGHNWKVPGEGTYTANVHVDRPSFFRHDPKNGKRYGQPVDVTFEQLRIDPGLKRSEDAQPRTQPTGPVD